MGIYRSGAIIYGVPLTEEEVDKCEQIPEWDDILDNYGHWPDMVTGTREIIIGIQMDSVEEGEFTEICVTDPNSKDIDGLLDALDTLGIEGEPSWYLMCQVG